MHVFGTSRSISIPVAARRLRSRLAALIAQSGGAAAVEFALVALPFFAIILATLQVAILFLAEGALETAVERSSRLILTGQAQGQAMTRAQFTQAICNNATAFITCGGLMVDVQPVGSFGSADTGRPNLTFDGSGQVNNNWQYNTGSPGSIIVVRAMYQLPVIQPFGFVLANMSNGSRLIMATAVFKNETYQ